MASGVLFVAPLPPFNIYVSHVVVFPGLKAFATSRF